jgi:hypothetical protein
VTDHFRRDCGLVNEHQARRLKRKLLGFQRGARSRNIRTILLGGVQSFFERDLVTIVEAPDRARSNLELLCAAEPQADVIERQVRLRGDKIEQPLLMLVQRRAAMAGAGLGLDAADCRPALDPADRRRGTDVEQTRCLPRAVTFLDNRDDPLPADLSSIPSPSRTPAVVVRGTESDLLARGNPYNPPDSNQAESALASSNRIGRSQQKEQRRAPTLASQLWIAWTTTEPSPTLAATRFTEPALMSPWRRRQERSSRTGRRPIGRHEYIWF